MPCQIVNVTLNKNGKKKRVNSTKIRCFNNKSNTCN